MLLIGQNSDSDLEERDESCCIWKKPEEESMLFVVKRLDAEADELLVDFLCLNCRAGSTNSTSILSRRPSEMLFML